MGSTFDGTSIQTAADYCTLAQLKAYIWPAGSTPDTADDSILSPIITAVSRQIDNYCNRRFYTTSSDETRYYPTQFADVVYPPDDIVSVTTLATDEDGDGTYESTWTTSDYRLCPINAALDGQPYTWITVKPLGNYMFPRSEAGVKVVGKFGWSATPDLVKEACLLQCTRIFERRNSPFGVVNNPVGGQVTLSRELDVDVQTMLDPVRRVR